MSHISRILKASLVSSSLPGNYNFGNMTFLLLLQAIVDDLALCTAIAVTTYSFYSVSRTAAYLMLANFGWVSFATFLTILYWKNNGNGSSVPIKED